MRYGWWFCVLVLGSPRLAAAELPPLMLPQGVGVNIHFTRGHASDLDRIAAAGIKVVRMDFAWAGIERKKGEYQWAEYDELTDNLTQRGIRPLYILDYSNALYEETLASINPLTGKEQRGVASPRKPESVAAFARWAGAAAARYRGRQVLWEIWNEPNISFWKPKPDVRDYITLARATCDAVKAADPEALILGPATSESPTAFLEPCFQAGLLRDFAAVSIHPYRNYKKPPETALEDYHRVRALIAKYAPPGRENLPIVSGEWGYATHAKGVSLEVQAQFAVRQQLVNLMAGIPISIWYDWKNDGPDPAEREHNFGLVDRDLAPKPAYKALQTMTRALDGCRIVRRVTLEKPGDYLLLLADRAGKSRLAAWTLNAPHEVALPAEIGVGPKAKAISGMGEPRTLAPRDGRLTLELGPLPVYVTLEPNDR